MNQRVEGLYKVAQDAQGEIDSLRNDIMEGKKTLGSKFDNFVFCTIGANPVDWEPFYSLNRQMKSSSGKEILIVKSHEKPYEPFVRHSGPERVGEIMAPIKITRKDYYMAYGVLTGKSLDFDLDASEIIFPNGRKYVHASANSVFSFSLTFEPLEIRRGRIREKAGDLTHLYKNCSLEGLRFMGHTQISQILVGLEVKKYFDEISQGDKTYSEIRGML